MNQAQNVEEMRSIRKELVLAAEAVIREAFSSADKDRQPPTKTQFSRLVGVCGEASCAEEIENYLRYQAGREAKRGRPSKKDESWRADFVNEVIAGVAGVLEQHSIGDDAKRVEAWQLYATYMARAYTYEIACQPAANHGSKPSKDRRRR